MLIGCCILIFESSVTASTVFSNAEADVRIEEIKPTIYFRKTGTNIEQAVDIAIFSKYSLNSVLLKVDYDDHTFSRKMKDLNAGHQNIRFYFPDIRKCTNIRLMLLHSDEKIDEKVIEWVPHKHWEVYIVHGSHHDLGYTDLPNHILKEHKGYIENILEYCELTETWADDSKFHYVFEEAWSVMYFMEHASSEQREKLIYYLKNGQLELTALFANQTTDICGFEELNRLIYPSFEMKRKYNIPVLTAEINDIPGINWGLVNVLANSGIKYLTVGIQDYFAWGKDEVPVPWNENQVMKRDRSSAFYWKGPNRKDSILLWYGGGSIANVWLWDTIQYENALNSYLSKEHNNGYEYDMIMAKVLGGLRDNSLPLMNLSKIVKTINEKWEYPKLKFTINAAFFKDFEEKHGADLKTLSGDFPQTDYNIGALSTPKETGVNMMNHNLVINAEKFSTIASSISDYPYAREQIAEAYEHMILYDEHCWGMASPTGPAQEAAESQKSYHAYQAAALGHDIIVKNLNKIADKIALKNKGIQIVVFNPLSHKRTDLVEVQALPYVPVGKPFYKEKRKTENHIYFVNRSGEVPGRKQLSIPDSILKEPFQIHDISSGKIIPHQIRVIDDPLLPIPYASSRYALGQSGTKSKKYLTYINNQITDLFFVAEDIPPMGYKVYQLTTADQKDIPATSVNVTNNTVENNFYKAVFSKKKGMISILDKEQNKQLINISDSFALGQIVIKSVKTNEFQDVEIYDVGVKESGPVFTSLYLQGKSVHCPFINQEIKIYHQLKKIEVATRIFKNPVPFQEIYVSFPFAIHDPRFHLASVNATMEPITDQLPGTTTDYYSEHHGLSISNGESTIVWNSIEAPVLKISELWPGYVSQAHHGITPDNYVHDFASDFNKSSIFSYVSVNNFRTNFSPVYTGDMLFRHSFTSYSGNYDPGKSNNFGWSDSNPLLPVIVNGPQSGELPTSYSFCSVTNSENIKVVTLKAAEDSEGLILRLAETSGKQVSATIKIPFIKLNEVYQTNIAEENLKTISHSNQEIEISADPFEIITLRLKSGIHTPGNNKFFYSY